MLFDAIKRLCTWINYRVPKERRNKHFDNLAPLKNRWTNLFFKDSSGICRSTIVLSWGFSNSLTFGWVSFVLKFVASGMHHFCATHWTHHLHKYSLFRRGCLLKCMEFGTAPPAHVMFCSCVTANCSVAGMCDTMLLPLRTATICLFCLRVWRCRFNISSLFCAYYSISIRFLISLWSEYMKNRSLYSNTTGPYIMKLIIVTLWYSQLCVYSVI